MVPVPWAIIIRRVCGIRGGRCVDVSQEDWGWVGFVVYLVLLQVGGMDLDACIYFPFIFGLYFFVLLDCICILFFVSCQIFGLIREMVKEILSS